MKRDCTQRPLFCIQCPLSLWCLTIDPIELLTATDTFIFVGWRCPECSRVTVTIARKNWENYTSDFPYSYITVKGVPHCRYIAHSRTICEECIETEKPGGFWRDKNNEKKRQRKQRLQCAMPIVVGVRKLG